MHVHTCKTLPHSRWLTRQPRSRYFFPSSRSRWILRSFLHSSATSALFRRLDACNVKTLTARLVLYVCKVMCVYECIRRGWIRKNAAVKPGGQSGEFSTGPRSKYYVDVLKRTAPHRIEVELPGVRRTERTRRSSREANSSSCRIKETLCVSESGVAADHPSGDNSAINLPVNFSCKLQTRKMPFATVANSARCHVHEDAT